MITYYRGEILQELPRERLIEIAHDLIWESEQRRQALTKDRADTLAGVKAERERCAAVALKVFREIGAAPGGSIDSICAQIHREILFPQI